MTSTAQHPHLLETGLDQVLWEQVPDEVQEGIKAADLLILQGCVHLGSEVRIPWVDPQNQYNP